MLNSYLSQFEEYLHLLQSPYDDIKYFMFEIQNKLLIVY